jgi:hypothetical protein
MAELYVKYAGLENHVLYSNCYFEGYSFLATKPLPEIPSNS